MWVYRWVVDRVRRSTERRAELRQYARDLARIEHRESLHAEAVRLLDLPPRPTRREFWIDQDGALRHGTGPAPAPYDWASDVPYAAGGDGIPDRSSIWADD